MHAFQKKHYRIRRRGERSQEKLEKGEPFSSIEQLNSLEKARRAYYSSHRSFVVHNHAKISYIFSAAFHH